MQADEVCGRRELHLLVIDSVSALVAPILGGARQSQGHVLMTTLGQQLRQLADRFGVAVLVTNHTVGGTSVERVRETMHEQTLFA